MPRSPISVRLTWLAKAVDISGGHRTVAKSGFGTETPLGAILPRRRLHPCLTGPGIFIKIARGQIRVFTKRWSALPAQGGEERRNRWVHQKRVEKGRGGKASFFLARPASRLRHSYTYIEPDATTWINAAPYQFVTQRTGIRGDILKLLKVPGRTGPTRKRDRDFWGVRPPTWAKACFSVA